MEILVPDTSIFIDLERGKLLEDLFKLGHEIMVPDLLYERELAGDFGAALVAFGLRIAELSPAELGHAIKLRRQHALLSTPDTFAFALARARAWRLLTVQGELCNLAVQEDIATLDILWVFDELHRASVVGASRLLAGLATLSSHPRCRLSKAEIAARLAKFSEPQ